MTFILGLTGSIGMGKSTTADIFRRLGHPVHDADSEVHALYSGAAAPLIEAVFPGTTCDGAVDRNALGKLVVGDPEAMRRLEAIVHPLVRERRDAFLANAAAERAPVAILDIPLLFETGGDAGCDAVIVVTAPPEVQRERVMARPGMTPERFEALRDRQISDAEKRARAHFLVDTSRGRTAAEHQVRDILRALAGRSGRSRS